MNDLINGLYSLATAIACLSQWLHIYIIYVLTIPSFCAIVGKEIGTDKRLHWVFNAPNDRYEINEKFFSSPNNWN